MGDEPILSIIQPVTIDTMLNWKTGRYIKVKIGLNFVTCERSFTTDTMLNNNSMTYGHGLKNVTCKQGLNWIIALAFAFRPVGVYKASEITVLYWCRLGVPSSDFRTVSFAGDSNLFVDVIL